MGKPLMPARSQGRLPKRRDEPVRRRRARWLAASMVVCLVAFSVLPASGKKKKPVSRTVTGVVLDESENPIVGASVELTDSGSGKKIAIYSQEGGKYSFADLNPNHDYELQAHAKNLDSDLRKVSSLDIRDLIVINLRIPPPKE